MVGLQERALPLPTTLHLLTTIPFHAYPCKGPLPPSRTQRHISPVLDVRPAVCSCYSQAIAAVIPRWLVQFQSALFPSCALFPTVAHFHLPLSNLDLIDHAGPRELLRGLIFVACSVACYSSIWSLSPCFNGESHRGYCARDILSLDPRATATILSRAICGWWSR